MLFRRARVKYVFSDVFSECGCGVPTARQMEVREWEISYI